MKTLKESQDKRSQKLGLSRKKIKEGCEKKSMRVTLKNRFTTFKNGTSNDECDFETEHNSD